MARTQALIIGSGVAGPAAALALQKAGLDSVVYEAHPTSAEGIGTFLTLATNGVTALRTLDAAQSTHGAWLPDERDDSLEWQRQATGRGPGERHTA